jgi:modification methylase
LAGASEVLATEVNRIYCGDSSNMAQIEDDSVDLIITSPPYNAQINYDVYNDNLPLLEYLQQINQVWIECFRVLKLGGRLCINSAGLFRHPYIPLHHYLTSQCLNLGFLMRAEIIWMKKTGINSGSTAWGSWCSPSNPTPRDSHEYINIFSKGQYHLEKKGQTDLTPKEFQTWTRGEWHFRTESAQNKHPAPFPEELPKRLIKLYSWIGGIVLDPFCGSGTTCYVAKMLKRKYIGYDLSPNYVMQARQRCSQTFLF